MSPRRPFDLETARRETPGCAETLHLNNAGSSLPPRPVLDAVIRHLDLEARIGGYEAADLERAACERVYDAAAALVGGRRDEIAVVESATRAWQAAFYALPLRPGDRILTGMNEYGSNYIAYLHQARRTGARIDVVPDDRHGQLDVAALREMLDERVRLVAIGHVPTNGGLVNPAAAVGRVVREARARGADLLYLLDACQSVGQMPIDVGEIGCDMLAATGRKFLRAPRGTGFLWVRRDVCERIEPLVLDNKAADWVARDRFEIRRDARRFESWERSYATTLGLGAAVEYAMAWGLDVTYNRVRSLADGLRRRLASLPGVALRDLGAEKCGIVTFTREGKAPGEIKARLAERRIHVTVSTVSSTRLDMEARGLTELVRASVHYYNSEDELDRFVEALGSL